MTSTERLPASAQPLSLSRFPSASLRELIYLSAPITFILFSGNLMGFCDRLYLARYSIESLEGCVNASYLAQLFQLCLSFLTSTVQVFVGQCIGAKLFNRVGAYVWQMIWISLLSLVITLPMGFVAESLFFSGTSVVAEGTAYFRWLMPFNFLFPFGAALSAFYFGQGKMQIVMWATFIANAFNVLLDPLLIFGIPNLFEGMGIRGAALATGLSQVLLCLIVFLKFLQKPNRILFGTSNYQIRWSILKKCLRLGLPRCISKLTIFSAWLASVRLMTLKGGDYLLTLSIGSSLNLLFSYINDGMGQGIITVASYLLGKKDYSNLSNLMRTSFYFLGLASLLIFIPCFIFPKKILFVFFADMFSEKQLDLLVRCCKWLWLYFIAYGVTYIPFGFLTALGDTFFKMVYNFFSTWVLNYMAVWIAINFFEVSADALYLIMAIGVFSSACVYFVRLKALKWNPLVEASSLSAAQ